MLEGKCEEADRLMIRFVERGHISSQCQEHLGSQWMLLLLQE